MEKKEKIEIRDHHIETILGKSPSWLIRWGTTIMAMVLLALLLISYFFPYPETISASIHITSQKAPLPIYFQETIQIQKVYIKENSYIHIGDTIAIGLTSSQKKIYIKSPGEGKVALTTILCPGTRLIAGEIFLFIVPPSDGTFVGIAQIPINALSKLQIGQSAQIKLDMYPYMEYGVLQGRISFIAQLPVNNHYRIMITFPKVNTSTYNKSIILRPEMTGIVNITTQNRNLLERLIFPNKH